ncbi:MAG TPA: hypothetical protein VFU13_08570 [Steroidobacteraceae bacterium]|nr:hypothetical protein [Steroidobacteraceae bacterium]
MRMRAGLLAVSLGLGCGALAAESTQKPAPRPQTSNEVETHIFQSGSLKGAEVENGVTEGRIVFVPFGERSKSTEEIRARLADPQQRKAMRAEHRASLEQMYPDIEDALKLDSTTQEALLELLTDQQMESLDAMFSDLRPEAFFGTQRLLEAENRKLDQLRAVLGDDGLARYQDYTTTVHERRQVRQVDAHLGVADKLSPEQKARLIQLFQEKVRMDFPPPAPMRMSERLRSRDPRSPTFQEEMQRESQLSTIAGNEQVLRLRETSNRWMAERASGFLRPAQIAALTKVNESDMARLRKWIEQARAQAGLDPAIPARGSDENTPGRKPATGEVTLDLTVRVNGGEPVHFTHTGTNGESFKFQASEDLLAEVEWTLFDDKWVDVRLTYSEEGPNGLRRLQGGSGFGTMVGVSGGTSPGDNAPGARGGGSSTIVMGRKAYSVELSASATAR